MSRVDRGDAAIDRVVAPREIDFGGFAVRRSMPSRECHSVGPWLFFDHFGPVTLPPGRGVDVIPHPHVNLSTVTYLFDGEIMHRDTIGSVQAIRPGAMNLMRAGRGIAHSERTGTELRAKGHGVHGLQLWSGLPVEHEEIEPAFVHYAAGELPTDRLNGVDVRVMIGSAFGLRSPVETLSPTLYAEASVPAGGTLALPAQPSERAVYSVSGRLRIDESDVPPHRLAVIVSDEDAAITAVEDCRLALIGGEPLGKRYMWWNFVSSRSARIEKAKEDWTDGRFGTIPGETEYQRLPERDSFFDR